MPRQGEQQQDKREEREDGVRRHGECKSMHFGPHQVFRGVPCQGESAPGRTLSRLRSGGWLRCKSFGGGDLRFHGLILTKLVDETAASRRACPAPEGNLASDF